MFDELSSRFEDAVKGLRGEAKISENNINDALKQVKKALLDADVSLSVVKEFISDVKEMLQNLSDKGFIEENG